VSWGLTTTVRSVRGARLLLSAVDGLDPDPLRVVVESPESAAIRSLLLPPIDSLAALACTAGVHRGWSGYRHRAVAGGELLPGGNPLTVAVLGDPGVLVGLSGGGMDCEAALGPNELFVRRGRGGGRVIASTAVHSLVDPGLRWRAFELSISPEGVLKIATDRGEELLVDGFAACSVSVSAPVRGGPVDLWVGWCALSEALGTTACSSKVSLYRDRPPPLEGVPEVTVVDHELVWIEREAWLDALEGRLSILNVGDRGDLGALRRADVLRSREGERDSHLAFLDRSGRALRAVEALRVGGVSLSTDRSRSKVVDSPQFNRDAPPALCATLSPELSTDDELLSGYEALHAGGPRGGAATEVVVSVLARLDQLANDPIQREEFLSELVDSLDAEGRSLLARILARSA
jgi:hypothetical protein